MASTESVPNFTPRQFLCDPDTFRPVESHQYDVVTSRVSYSGSRQNPFQLPVQPSVTAAWNHIHQ